MSSETEYLDVRTGKARTYSSKEAYLSWEETKLKVMKELQEDGYTILDQYKRPIRI